MSIQGPRTTRVFALAALAAAAGLLVAADRSEAGMMATCDEPAVFPGAALNVVVLAYQADPAAGRPLAGPARDLGLLVQLNSLLTLGRYGSLAAVYLHSRAERVDCSADLVARQLLGTMPGAATTIQPGKALILLWGRIYQEGSDIYLQSHMRFLRRDVADGVESRLTAGDTLRAHTPAESLTFSPRRMAEKDLIEIEEQFKHAARVYGRPDESAASEPLPIANLAPVAYQVEQVRGDWLQVSGEQLGPGRWLKARIDPRLRQRMPELDFLDAVAGYLQLRVTLGGGGRPVAAMPGWIADSLARYREESWNERQGADLLGAEALGKALLGNLGMLAGHPDAAEQLYREAVAAAPYSGDARNLATLASAARLSNADLARQAGALVGGWQEALAVEPGNLDVVDNLGAIYRRLLVTASEKGRGVLMIGDGLPSAGVRLSREELTLRLDAVAKARTEIVKRRPRAAFEPPPPP